MQKQRFLSLIERVRRGESEACTELVQDYGPIVLRVAKSQLGDARVRSVLDNEDICQSVMRSFFWRAADGKYVLDEPAQLVSLLIAMTRNKVVDKLRKKSNGHEFVLDAELIRALQDPQPSPADVAARNDLLNYVLRRLDGVERQLVERRAEGKTWREIGVEFGQNGDALRKRLTRALDIAQAESLVAEKA